MRRWNAGILFALIGGLMGFAVYTLADCSGGLCAITSNPVTTTLYMAIAGWLLSGSIPEKVRK